MAEEVDVNDFLKNPTNISLKVAVPESSRKFVRENVVSLNFSNKDNEDFIIFDVKSKAHESFFMEFYELADDDEFQVLIVDMKRPTLEQFINSTIVTKKNPKFFYHNRDKWDKFSLIVINPGNNTPVGTEKEVVFSVYTPKCIRWNKFSRSWNFACSIFKTTTTDRIDCACRRFSTLAGEVQFNDVKKQRDFIKLTFVLEEICDLYIISIVVVLMFLYFFLLIYSVQRDESLEDAAYFVSDVPAENRYAYLVSVHTGLKIDSGTSSNICVKLIGSIARSQEHVLNFPDPLLKLLQRNQKDLFVLATPVHLGELLRLNVWFDCTGSSPTWYCHRIDICDLQTEKWYTFEFNKWFKIDEKPELFMTAAAVPFKVNQKITTSEPGSRFIHILLTCGHFNKSLWYFSTRSFYKHFGYPKRLTVILSIILTIMNSTMLFYQIPEFLPRDSITADCHFVYGWSDIWIATKSALVAFFINMAIKNGFKNSQLQFERGEIRKHKKWSFSATIILWVLLIANVLVHLHILLLFGIRMKKPLTTKWLVSVALALFLTIFVIDFLYNIMKIFFGKAIRQVKINYQKIIAIAEIQRKFLYHYIGKYIYRPILVPIYKLMSKGEFIRKKTKFMQKREVLWHIQDLILITLYLAFLYIMLMEDKDTTYDTWGNNQAFQLIRGPQSAKMRFERVTELDEFEAFMEHTFLPSLQSYQWYGRYISESPGMTSDASNKYLGVIRLRQHRVDDYSCDVPETMTFINRTCRSSSYFFHFDFQNYTPGWNNTIENFHVSRLGPVWGYHEGVGEAYFGEIGFYRPGGYVAHLGRNIHNSYVNFNYLKRYSWLDPLTRALLIEFPLYNVNRNLFHFVQIVMEKTPSGYINKQTDIRTQRIFKIASKTRFLSLILAATFTSIVILLCARTVLRVYKTKILKKRDLWHVLDIAIVLVTVSWAVLSIKQLQLLKTFVQELEVTRSNKFINYLDLIALVTWTKSLSSILIAVSTIRIWKILRFAVIFRTVERTISNSFLSFVYILLDCFIIFTALGFMVFIILGAKNKKFKSGSEISKSFLMMSIGAFEIDDVGFDENERGLGYFFFILSALASLFFANIFITIVLVHYARARQYAFDEKIDYNIKDYTMEKLKAIKRSGQIWLRKFRLTAGGEEQITENMVTPKEDSMRYKNNVEISSQRLSTMAQVTRCVLMRMLRELRTEKVDDLIMWRAIKSLHEKRDSQNERFFVEKEKGGEYKIVADRRVLMMEKVVKYILKDTDDFVGDSFDVKSNMKALLVDNRTRMKKMSDELSILLNAVKNIEIKI